MTSNILAREKIEPVVAQAEYLFMESTNTEILRSLPQGQWMKAPKKSESDYFVTLNNLACKPVALAIMQKAEEAELESTLFSDKKSLQKRLF